MSKKIIVLAASPRVESNSEILADRFAEGAKAAGNHVEKIRIAFKKIHFCQACFSCRKTKKCVQADDMAPILEKMVAADVIVLATPVYFYGMSGMMKTFLDRTMPRYLEFAGKDFYVIMTCADPADNALTEIKAGFYGYFRCVPSVGKVTYIGGKGFGDQGTVKGSAVCDFAYESGKAV